ncbi:hypothetical protein [Pasteuria penetrans]|nr:hypothetical protein [Pasteuria penetrans]
MFMCLGGRTRDEGVSGFGIMVGWAAGFKLSSAVVSGRDRLGKGKI